MTPVPGPESSSSPVPSASPRPEEGAAEGGNENQPTGIPTRNPDAAAAGNSDVINRNPDADQEDSKVTTIPVVLENGKLKAADKGEETGASNSAAAVLSLQQGNITMKVNHADELNCSVLLEDVVAVANAILSADELSMVAEGGSIELRFEVKPADTIAEQEDRELIEQNISTYYPDCTVGMYMDVSVFMQYGTEEWRNIRETSEPIAIVFEIPESLRGLSANYYVMRVHEGDCQLLEDKDESEETITIETSLFSSYAIVYEPESGEVGAGKGKCSLCHLCPTFLGVCCFVWLAIAAVAMFAGAGILIMWKKKEKQA